MFETGHTVGVISVDPSSPFSKGALLGDRSVSLTTSSIPGVHPLDGNQGHLVGLAEATPRRSSCSMRRKRPRVSRDRRHGPEQIEVIGVADTVVLVLMPGRAIRCRR